MKKINKFIFFTLLELLIIGFIILFIGIKSGANIEYLCHAIIDRCIELFQWATKWGTQWIKVIHIF